MNGITCLNAWYFVLKDLIFALISCDWFKKITLVKTILINQDKNYGCHGRSTENTIRGERNIVNFSQKILWWFIGSENDI